MIIDADITLLDYLLFLFVTYYRGSPSHPGMMGGPMPVRGPGQGPRGTGAGMRGQMGRGDYGKYCLLSMIIYSLISRISVLTYSLLTCKIHKIISAKLKYPHYRLTYMYVIKIITRSLIFYKNILIKYCATSLNCNNCFIMFAKH